MADDPEPPSRKGPGKTLWVNPKDEFGNLADPIFVEAAFEILEELLQYRAAELQDESRALELIEKAVHAASRSRKGQNIRDAAAYLFRVFQHLVDAEIDRSHKFVPLNDDLLHKRADGQEEPDLEEDLGRRLTVEKLGPIARLVFLGLLAGRRLREVAGEIGMKPNALYQHISRIRKELKTPLDGNRIKAPISGSDGKNGVESREAEGHSSPRRGKRAA